MTTNSHQQLSRPLKQRIGNQFNVVPNTPSQRTLYSLSTLNINLISMTQSTGDLVRLVFVAGIVFVVDKTYKNLIDLSTVRILLGYSYICTL